MQLVIYPGDPYVFATHDDAQDLTGLYAAAPVTPPPELGAPYVRPAAEIVPWPRTSPLRFDDEGRMLDPRQT
jgi:hypothetical protein